MDSVRCQTPIACCSVVPTVTVGLQRLASRRERPLLIAGAGNLPLAVRVDRPAVAAELEHTLRLVYGAGDASRLGMTVITYDKETTEECS